MTKIPAQLGPLKLVQKIGVGRHCQVWEAVDEGSGQRAAVKVVVPEAAADSTQRKRLEYELKVAHAVRHPMIIRIDRFSDEGGLPHLVMELYPHPNLKQQIAAGVAPLAARVPRIVLELAMALDHMHARGWVHRDVKPDNVLTAADGRPIRSICQSGFRSYLAHRVLVSHGVDSASLDGGMHTLTATRPHLVLVEGAEDGSLVAS